MQSRGRWVLLGLLAASAAGCEKPPPPATSTSVAVSASAPSGPSAPPAASASAPATAAAEAGAAPAVTATPEAPGPMIPKVVLKKVYTGEQEQEGWPQYEYTGLPAAADDGSKVAVVEERDGWGHTKTPGIRILDATGKSVGWFALVPPGRSPANEATATKMEPTFQGLVKKANDELAKTTWLALSSPPATTRMDGKSFRATVNVGPVALRMSFLSEDDYKGRVVPEAMSIVNSKTSSLTTIDTATWAAKARCATPSFKVVGLNEKARIAVFHQQLGTTSHACDGVAVPHDWRVVKF